MVTKEKLIMDKCVCSILVGLSCVLWGCTDGSQNTVSDGIEGSKDVTNQKQLLGQNEEAVRRQLGTPLEVLTHELPYPNPATHSEEQIAQFRAKSVARELVYRTARVKLNMDGEVIEVLDLTGARQLVQIATIEGVDLGGTGKKVRVALKKEGIAARFEGESVLRVLVEKSDADRAAGLLADAGLNGNVKITWPQNQQE